MASGIRVPPGTMGPASSIVGRAAERVLLAEQLRSAQSGRGNLVILGGEAGIGKTTLARELAAQARADGSTVVVGHSYDMSAAPPYGLWLDLADRYRDLPNADALPPLPEVLASRTLDAVTSQSVFFAEVTAFLRAIAATGPAVIVLEDVHWADPASLELLRHVSVRIDHLPLLLLVTYREDELTRQNPFYQRLPALVRDAEGLRLDLRRLGSDDLASLVRLHYALPDDDRDRLVAYLARHADGNPFFTIELLRAMEERGDGGLIRADDGWLLGSIDSLTVPPLIRQVIDARVSRLGEEVRDPLTVASVIGDEAPIALLASLNQTTEDATLRAIDPAIEWHLCSATPDGRAITFTHALTREALYASIPLHRRRELHRHVAEALERGPRADPDTIAWHYQQAGNPRATDWLIRAGERAQRAYAWLTARARFAAAADLLEGVQGEEITRARLLYRCGRLQRYTNASDALACLRTAAGLADAAGDHVLAADALYSQGLVHCFADDWAHGVPEMVRGIEVLRGLPSRETYISWSMADWMADALPTLDQWAAKHPDATGDRLVAIDANRHMSLAWFLAESGRLEEALAVARAYESVSPESGIGPLAIANTGHAQFGLGIALASQGDPEGAAAAFQRARQAYADIDHHACLAFVLLAELTDVVLPYRADDPAARRAMAEAAGVEIERARGALTTQATSDVAQITVHFLDGRWTDASRIAAALTDPGAYLLRRQVTNALAPMAYLTGDIDEAWRHIGGLLADGPAAAPGAAVLLDGLMLQQLATRLCIDAGALDDAARWLEGSARWLAWSGSTLGRAGHALAAARLHHARGRIAEALTCANDAVTAASSPRQPVALIDALRFRGALTRDHGDDPVAAERDISGSLDLAAMCAIPHERAMSLIELAALRRATDPAGARGMAEEARSIATDLGAGRLIERSNALLASLNDSPAPDLPGGLTQREAEVLRLVARGMTDADVASALSISPRTVGQHLRSIYSKLDVRSRTAAARFAIEHRVVRW